jgi:hypothetical protein
VPETPLRNRDIQRRSRVIVVIATVAGVALAVAGVIMLAKNQMTAAAVLLAAGVGFVIFSFLFDAIVSMLLQAEGNINRIHHDALDLVEFARRLEPMVKTICDNSQISDGARSIAHRELEREAFRQAIREEMFKGDWEAALYLIDQMEQRLGYAQEAKTLRAELGQIREMTIEEKIGEALSHIEKMMGEFNWERARVESERLLKLFPRHERIMALPAELRRRREARKQALLGEWRTAVEREEIDRGIAMLTELDQYLSPDEARSLQESARHVFKARLLNLGVQFGLAVSEARWRDALEVGLEIRQEFPNSRMAQEVADKLDVLRVRSGFVADAELIQSRTPAAR